MPTTSTRPVTAAQQFLEKLLSEGHLSEVESLMLTKYEFHHGPKTVDDQVMHYYLKIKSKDVSVAARMWSELEEYLLGGDDHEKIEAICLILSRYQSHIVINFRGGRYMVADGKVICL